jgi:dTDP-4-dehydrorhamnose 3,5-epimerase
MNQQFIKSNKGNYITDLYLTTPDIFKDERGYFYESWNKKKFQEMIGKQADFVQDNKSFSKKGVLRGLHYQLNPLPQGKLVSCLKGQIYDVAVDLRKDSKTFSEWVGVFLDENNKKQFWVPEGFAHGFLTISESAEVSYKTTNFWDKNLERCIKWDDKKLAINWPLKILNLSRPFLSNKDNNAISFEKALNNCEVL